MLQRNITRRTRLSASIFVAILLCACSPGADLTSQVQPRHGTGTEAVLSPFGAFFFGGSEEELRPDLGLPARVARLRRKARQMRGPVLSNRERRRLLAALARHSG